MAILAECLVEEWLNQARYFTIRGIKHGHGEMDLLGVRHDHGVVDARHVEVTVSFRPIGYIAIEPASAGRPSSYVRTRTPDQIRDYALRWVDAKFRSPDKVRLRDRLWPDLGWSYHLVHGVTRYPLELEAFRAEGVTCHPFHRVLADLSRRGDFSGSAGGDLAEIISYYKSHETGDA